MRVVVTMTNRHGSIRKKAVVQKGAFQNKVSQSIEGMPDEKNTEFSGGGGAEEA